MCRPIDSKKKSIKEMKCDACMTLLINMFLYCFQFHYDNLRGQDSRLQPPGRWNTWIASPPDIQDNKKMATTE